MRYRRLGRTGLKVSVVGVGTWQFGGEWGVPSPVRGGTAAGRAGEQGINLIDTAECYGDHLSEALIGAAIRGERERGSWPPSSATSSTATSAALHNSAAEVQEQLEASPAGAAHGLYRSLPDPFGQGRRVRPAGTLWRCSARRSRPARSATWAFQSARTTTSTRRHGPSGRRKHHPGRL